LGLFADPTLLVSTKHIKKIMVPKSLLYSWQKKIPSPKPQRKRVVIARQRWGGSAIKLQCWEILDLLIQH